MKETIKYLIPEKTVYIKGNIKNEQTLLVKKPEQIALGEQDTAIFKGECKIVFDFGHEIQGGVRILTHYITDGMPVRLRFGESLTEALTPAGVKNATNDHSLRDFTVSLPQLSDQEFAQTGFRFLCIEFYGGEYYIKNVYAKSVYEQRKVEGSFICSDERLNKIYSVAQKTLLLCMQHGMIWDGIKRDRLVWIGDLHPETLGLLYTSSEIENLENCIDFATKETPPNFWMNGHASYSFWWILTLHDYLRFTGKKEKVGLYVDYLDKLVKNIDDKIEENGKTHFPNYFLDWPSSGTEDSKTGCIALLKIAMQKAKEIFTLFGLNCSYADSVLNKLSAYTFIEPDLKQAIAIKYLSDKKDSARVKEKLSLGGADGYSTFLSYYIATALKNAGGVNDALNSIRDYYGGMLDMGATTFWEDFNLKAAKNCCPIDRLPEKGEEDVHGDRGDYCYKGFRHSLCHGWSCGPIAFLTETVLGINVAAMACKKIEISPKLCGLSFAKGSIPTPYGTVKVSHKVNKNGIDTEVIAPEKIEIVANGCNLTRKFI